MFRQVVILLAVVTLAVTPAAAVIITGYTPAVNELSSPTSLISGFHNLGGFVQDAGGRWRTYITPHYYLTSGHWPSGTNTRSVMVGTSALDIRVGYDAVGSSVWYGISVYSTWRQCTDLVYVIGRPQRVGTNHIDAGGRVLKGAAMIWQNVPNETTAESGDSGGPVFAAYGDRLALVMIVGYVTAFPGYAETGGVYTPSVVPYIQALVDEPVITWCRPWAADADLDGAVGPGDWKVLNDNFGRSDAGVGWSTADFNGDGEVGLEDFAILKDHMGEFLPYRTVFTVPEPMTISFLFLSSLAALFYTRRRR